MLQPKPLQSADSPIRSAARAPAPQPFFGAMGAILVDDRGEFSFEGAIRRREAAAVWQWLARDIAPESIASAAQSDDPAKALELSIASLLTAARAAAAAAKSAEAERRLRAQLDGNDNVRRLPAVLNALRCLPLYGKAQAFGRAINGMPDDDAPVAALQSMPRQDASVAALLMMAAVGEVFVPERLIIPATKIAGEAEEIALQRAGFGPLVDAMLAHAQNALPPLLDRGVFADADLICRAIERFHRLVRALTANVELAPRGAWSMTIAGLTKTIADRLEPRLRDVLPSINQALRLREGNDWLDSDSMLAALNGLYLLTVVRDTRDSLALNKAFEETWERSAQVLELHLNRNLDALRQDPANRVLAARMESGVKMAEIRFGTEYAGVLRSALEGIGRRASG